MVYVPEGSFTMGSKNGRPDESPVHTVTLDTFWIDQTEVTNARYALCVQTGRCQAPLFDRSNSHSSYYGNSYYADFPVIYVNWDQANAYCVWAEARLPSEAEWEKAAKGTDGRTYPWGTGIDKSHTNYNQEIGDTTKVGSYASGASPYGALDMAGNVFEWVNDWYSPYGPDNVSNPHGPATGDKRVMRGGSWNNNDADVRTTIRYRAAASVSYDYLGFRCARSK